MNLSKGSIIIGVLIALMHGIFLQSAFASSADISEQDVLLRAQEGDKNSQFRIGYLLLAGTDEVRDEINALYWIRCASMKKHAKSTVLLSQFYRYGWANVNIDLNLSRRLLEQASEMSDGEAFFLLGVYYDLGIGVQRNTMKAQNYYKLALKYGYFHALLNLGKLLLESSEKTDIQSGVMYLEKAGYNGYTEGFRLLSFMYREGEYVGKNENLARYYEKLATMAGALGVDE